jgi:hypothetical protein
VRIARRAVEPLAKRLATYVLARLIGSWILESVAGGRDALIASGVPRSTAYKARQDFRNLLGVEYEGFRLHPHDAERIKALIDGAIDENARPLFDLPKQ